MKRKIKFKKSRRKHPPSGKFESNFLILNNENHKHLKSLKDVYDFLLKIFEKLKNEGKINNFSFSERESFMGIEISFFNNKKLNIEIFLFKEKEGDFYFKEINSIRVHFTIYQRILESIFYEKIKMILNTRYAGYKAEEQVKDIIKKNFLDNQLIGVENSTNDEDKYNHTDMFLIIKEFSKKELVKIPVDITLNKKSFKISNKDSFKIPTITYTHIFNSLKNEFKKQCFKQKLQKLISDFQNRKIKWKQKKIYL